MSDILGNHIDTQIKNPIENKSSIDLEAKSKNDKLNILVAMLDDVINIEDTSDFFSDKNENILTFLKNNLNKKIEGRFLISDKILSNIKKVVLLQLKENDINLNISEKDIKLSYSVLGLFLVQIEGEDNKILWNNGKIGGSMGIKSVLDKDVEISKYDIGSPEYNKIKYYYENNITSNIIAKTRPQGKKVIKEEDIKILTIEEFETHKDTIVNGGKDGFKSICKKYGVEVIVYPDIESGIDGELLIEVYDLVLNSEDTFVIDTSYLISSK